MCGGWLFGASEVAAEQLEYRTGQQTADRQQSGPAHTGAHPVACIRAGHAGADNHHHADKTADYKQPLAGVDALAQYGHGQKCHQHRRDHQNGGKFADLHHFEAVKGQSRADDHHNAAQQLHQRLACPEQIEPVQRYQNGCGGNGLHHIAHPQSHDGRNRQDHELCDSINQGETGRGPQNTGDAAQFGRF